MKACMCHYPGCSRVTQGWYCAEHKALCDERRAKQNTLFKDTKRVISAPYNPMYHSAQWKKTRKDFLETHPYCVCCGSPATVVDHIKAHKGNDKDFNNILNLQSMCASCHSKKTLFENGYFHSKNNSDR